MHHFYRLFSVCVMLREVRVPGRGIAHNYPQLQLLYMLILAYQYKHKLVSYTMLLNNQSMFNEDMGEITFSVLSRCVLGDNVKCMFSHMEKMYCLIPYVQQVVSDITDDFASKKNSINWRHKVRPDSVEVKTTEVYFASLIRQVVSGVFRCYDGTEAGYKSMLNARQHMIYSSLPVVYVQDIMPVVETMLGKLSHNMSVYNMHQYKHVWPEADPPMFEGVPHDIIDRGELKVNDEVAQEREDASYSMADYEIEDDIPLSPIDYVTDSDVPGPFADNDDGDVVPDGHEDEFDLSQPSQTHLNRSWDSWGTVHSENILSRNRVHRYRRGRNDVIEPGIEELFRRVERKRNRP